MKVERESLFLNNSRSSTFGFQIARVVILLNKFGSMSKNNLAILFRCYFGHFHFSFSSFSVKKIINTLLRMQKTSLLKFRM